jgi:hypothetical protein
MASLRVAERQEYRKPSVRMHHYVEFLGLVVHQALRAQVAGLLDAFDGFASRFCWDGSLKGLFGQRTGYKELQVHPFKSWLIPSLW